MYWKKWETQISFVIYGCRWKRNKMLTLSSFADFECILKSEYKPTVYAPTLEKNEYIFFSKCLLRKESSQVVYL